jgi:hypothetical protein
MFQKILMDAIVWQQLLASEYDKRELNEEQRSVSG